MPYINCNGITMSRYDPASAECVIEPLVRQPDTLITYPILVLVLVVGYLIHKYL